MISRNVRTGCYSVSPLFVVSLVSMAYSGTLYAHAQFKVDSVTPPRYNTASIKTSPPCGDDASFGSLRTNRKGIFVSGETINVEWIETVNHGGSYVFDFSPANDQGFESNPIMTVTDTQNGAASQAQPHYYSQAIQMNYAVCDSCTLRMRQDMENAQNYYYSCADIVIVSGSDITPPQEASAVTATAASIGVLLTWSNPVDAKGIIVLRNTAAIVAQPSVRTDYVTGDTIGNAQVVYKGAGSEFTDTNVAAETEYTYSVIAFDSDYNYNNGVSQSITTAAVTNPGGNNSNNGGGGGAGFWITMLLAPFAIFRRFAREKMV